MKKQKIYKIYTSECREYTGGSMTVEEMAQAFTDVDDISYLDGGNMPGMWHEYDDIYHCQGDHTLADTIVEQENCSLCDDEGYGPDEEECEYCEGTGLSGADGPELDLNLELKTSIFDNDTDFVMYAELEDPGTAGDYTIVIDGDFDIDIEKITVREENGLVLGYYYEDERFDGSPKVVELNEEEGSGYNNPTLNIYVKGTKGYESFSFIDVFSNMQEEGVNISDYDAVLGYLKKSYSLGSS